MKENFSILVVDDEPLVLDSIKQILQIDYNVYTAESGPAAIEVLNRRYIDIVLSDIFMPKMSGLELFEKVKETHPDIQFIFITGAESINNVIEALRLGATDYIRKPFTPAEIQHALKRITETRQLKARLQHYTEEAASKYSFANIIGSHPKMQEVFKVIQTVAESDAAVLITGETGTGKEIVAKAIHYQSARSSEPFIAINCSAIPDTLLESELFGHEKGAFTGAIRRKSGRFEQAHKGTTFLDEIGEISPIVQVKLLRFLQEKVFEKVGSEQSTQVDVRIIAATNRDLENEIEANRFREDLYYRLNVIQINLPPLRERVSDIELLVSHFLNKYGGKYHRPPLSISRDCLRELVNYHWPGNVRELENVIERAVIMTHAEMIEEVSLPASRPTPQENATSNKRQEMMRYVNLKDFVAECEKEYLSELLKVNKGSIQDTSVQAGINNKTLFIKMKKYNLDKIDFK